MGLIHKTKFVPFIDVSTTTTPSWKQIKKSTTFSMAFNPQTKTFDFISSENPEEEIDCVTTPGGLTIKGLNSMEENGFTNAVIKGLKAGR